MRQNKRADNLYTIEQKAQKLFSSDEASLLEEMDEAERIWAEEKIRILMQFPAWKRLQRITMKN